MFSVKYKIIFIIFLANFAFVSGFFITQNIKKMEEISNNEKMADLYQAEQKQEEFEVIKKELESDETRSIFVQRTEETDYNSPKKDILYEVP